MSPASTASTDAAWYVYAVIDATDALAVQAPAGIDAAPVEIVASGDLAAVAGPVALAGFRAAQAEAELSEGAWLAGALRAHHHVVEQVFAQVPVLPLRFGALRTSPTAVAEMLESSRTRLRGGLRRVAGAGEWTVRVVASEPATEPVASARVDPSDGTAWMLRRREAALARRATRDRWARTATVVHDVLSRHCREAHVALRSNHPSQPPVRVIYLVGRAEEETFAAAVRELADRELDAGLRLEVDGPRPAYHFVEPAGRVGADGAGADG